MKQDPPTRTYPAHMDLSFRIGAKLLGAIYATLGWLIVWHDGDSGVSKPASADPLRDLPVR